jgi:hypothetical protein
MDSPFSTILGPIAVLWIGALVFYALDRFLDPQDRGVAEAIVLALALGFALNAGARLDEPIPFGPPLAELGWEGMPPFLIAGRTAWLLSVLLLGIAFLASLATLGRSTVGRSGRLASLGGAMLFIAAGDWASLSIAWLLVDLALATTLNAGQERRERLRWTLSLSLAGVVLLGVVLILWQRDTAVVLVDPGGTLPLETVVSTPISSSVAGLVAVAALLRLMPFPLPAWYAAAEEQETPDTRPTTRVIVYAIPTLLCAYLWARLAQWEGIQAVGWVGLLPLWGALAMLVGAIRAWGVQDPDRLVTCAHIYGGALVLLGAGLGLPYGWQLSLGAASVLGISTLFVAWTQCQHFEVFDVGSYWRVVPTLLALLSVAGFPFTAGLSARVAVHWSVFAAKQWISLLLVLAAESLFLGGWIRILLELEGTLDDDVTPRRKSALWSSLPLPSWVHKLDLQREIGYAAGAVLALGLLLLGFAPRVLSGVGLGAWFRLPTLPVWAALLLPTVGAVMLYRARDPILDFAGDWWPLIQRLFSLDWLYRGLETVLQHVGSLIWGGTLVVEGAGYMAWVVLVCLIILMFVISR